MKTVVHDRYGSIDVLEFLDIPRPPVGDDDVLVRVHAAGVNLRRLDASGLTVQSGDIAKHVVKRYQQESETKHQHRNHRQF